MGSYHPTNNRGLTKRRFLDVIKYLDRMKLDLKKKLPKDIVLPTNAVDEGLTIYDFQLVAEGFRRAHSNGRNSHNYYSMLMSRLYAELRSTDITTNDESINETHDPRLDKLSQETLDKMETLIKEELDGEGNSSSGQ